MIAPERNRENFADPYVKEVKIRHRYKLLLKPYVQGVGLGTKRTAGADTGVPCIVIYVYPKMRKSQLGNSELIPLLIEDVLTDVVELRPTQAEVRTSQTTVDPRRTRRWRPAPGGVSVGHFQLNGAGTLSGWVRDKETGEPLLLSCWHVLTNYRKARKGDPILQPATIDGGTVETDTIGHLERWVDVKMLGPNLGEAKSNLKFQIDSNRPLTVNYVDAAVARPVSDDVVSCDILGLERPKGVTTPQFGDNGVTSGRTSGITYGKISAVGVDMFVGYPTGIALFLDCVVT